MSAARMRELLSTRHNTLTTSGYSSVSRTLQFTPSPPSTTAVASIETPKMDMIYSPSPIITTSAGPLEFLDDQKNFDNIFGHNPVMLLISARSSRAIEDSETFHSKLVDICNLSNLNIFVRLFNCNTLGPQHMTPTR